MSIFTGRVISGINTDDTNCPPDIIQYIGFGAVRQDFGVNDPPVTYIANVQAQLNAGLKVLCTVHNLGQAYSVFKAFGSKVDIEYKNEINLQTLDSGANQDFSLLGNYYQDCLWLLENKIKCWIGCISTAMDEPTTRNMVRALASVLPKHHGLAWHGYGNNPGHIADGVAAVQKYWLGPSLMTEWSPQPFIFDPDARAAWHAAARKDFIANRMTGFTYRLIDPGDNSGFVINKDWSLAGYSLNAAGLALRAHLN